MDHPQPKNSTSASAPPRPAPPYAPPQYVQPAPHISYAPQAPHIVSCQPPQLVHHAQQVMPQPVYLAQQGPTTTLPMGATTITVVGGTGGGDRLLPGMCSVCRMGHIKNRPTCCTYLFCLLLLPIGIVPGLIAYYFCFREPACGNCHFKL